MYTVFACMYACAPHTSSGLKRQKRVLDPPEVELQVVVSHHAGPLEE